MIIKKTPEQIQKMREAGLALAAVVRELEKEITPGITAQELNDLAHELMVARNAVPSFLGYQGYPASICVSP
ncbi:MAG: M24 family metallopeptidase, partial [Actinomycetota bacterium]